MGKVYVSSKMLEYQKHFNYANSLVVNDGDFIIKLDSKGGHLFENGRQRIYVAKQTLEGGLVVGAEVLGQNRFGTEKVINFKQKIAPAPGVVDAILLNDGQLPDFETEAKKARLAREKAIRYNRKIILPVAGDRNSFINDFILSLKDGDEFWFGDSAADLHQNHVVVSGKPKSQLITRVNWNNSSYTENVVTFDVKHDVFMKVNGVASAYPYFSAGKENRVDSLKYKKITSKKPMEVK
jgi:hypothetical protein